MVKTQFRKRIKKNAKNKTMKMNRTSINRSPLNKKPMNVKTKSKIVHKFFEILNMVKLYHWKTYSYAQHKASDELYESLNEHIDKFVEVLLGKDQSRVKMIEKQVDLLDFNNTDDFKNRVFEYRKFLTDMSLYLNPKTDTDLLTIRDELLVDINQFLYLLTFSK
jgi:hypothetical protein